MKGLVLNIHTNMMGDSSWTRKIDYLPGKNMSLFVLFAKLGLSRGAPVGKIVSGPNLMACPIIITTKKKPGFL